MLHKHFSLTHMFLYFTLLATIKNKKIKKTIVVFFSSSAYYFSRSNAFKNMALLKIFSLIFIRMQFNYYLKCIIFFSNK